MQHNKLMQRILAALRDSRIDVIVVGGYAWERAMIPVGTLDLDVLVLSKDYERAVKEVPRALAAAGLRAREVEYHPIMTLFRVENTELEAINSRAYNTSKRGFYAYAKQYRTWRADGIHYADLELVWYMRLCIGDWRPYLTKSLRDAYTLHATRRPPADLRKIADISKAMESYKKLRPRLKALRTLLRSRGLPY